MRRGTSHIARIILQSLLEMIRSHYPDFQDKFPARACHHPAPETGRGSDDVDGDEYERLVNLNVAEFQRFSDRVGAKAQEAGMTEEVLQELLRNV